MVIFARPEDCGQPAEVVPVSATAAKLSNEFARAGSGSSTDIPAAGARAASAILVQRRTL